MAERYSKAASAGDDQAQFYLGALYSSGVGLAQSDREASKWITRAAEQGHSQAMLVLAALLAIGRGTAKDEVAAYKWAYIVAEGSRVFEFKNGARQLLTLLETRMTPAKVAEAKADADRFRETKPQLLGTPNPAKDAASRPAPQSPAPITAREPQRTAAPSPSPGPTNDAARRSSSQSPAPTTAREREPHRTPASSSSSGPSARALPLPKNDRNADIDRMLDMVPPGMRKQYGF